jgi:hypothetical protein
MRRSVVLAAIPMTAAACGSTGTGTSPSPSPRSAVGSWYVVVHVGPDMTGTNSKYLLCGNLFK